MQHKRNKTQLASQSFYLIFVYFKMGQFVELGRFGNQQNLFTKILHFALNVVSYIPARKMQKVIW